MIGNRNTVPVMDGKITKFEDYAKNFLINNCYHLEGKKEYEKMVVSKHLEEKVNELKNEINFLNNSLDESILEDYRRKLNENKVHYL